ncbi:MAG: 2-C-methyl-D-erythritol 4-phosphate cytidylyltransferase [Chloroflexota bacterium]|nr:2-C-methyl-D-erythritol 4-phosphate cytidylyltransferase [Chloroflexota bacterium]
MTDPELDAFASVVIVAAGRGERFGHPAKVLAVAGGRPLLAWSLIAASQSPCVREILIVSGEHTDEAIRHLLIAMPMSIPVTLVTGGPRRQDSVAAGVAAVSPVSDVILIHDGARPLATAAMFDACAVEARRSGAAIVAIPISDSLKRVHDLSDLSDLSIEESVPRDGLWGAQTPQGFRRELIQHAIQRTRIMDNEFTDEASLLEALGEPVRVVPGDRTNIKVTHPEDLELVDALLWRRSIQAQEVQR